MSFFKILSYKLNGKKAFDFLMYFQNIFSCLLYNCWYVVALLCFKYATTLPIFPHSPLVLISSCWHLYVKSKLKFQDLCSLDNVSFSGKFQKPKTLSCMEKILPLTYSLNCWNNFLLWYCKLNFDYCLSLGCYDKLHRLGGLHNTYFSQFGRLEVHN